MVVALRPQSRVALTELAEKCRAKQPMTFDVLSVDVVKGFMPKQATVRALRERGVAVEIWASDLLEAANANEGARLDVALANARTIASWGAKRRKGESMFVLSTGATALDQVRTPRELVDIGEG